MGAKSDIQWTDATWSPTRARVKDNAREIALERGWVDLLPIVAKMRGHVGPHCEQISPGCHNCYSLTNNGRCLPNNGTGLPFDKRSRELVDIFVDEKILMQPLHWKAPKKIFVENQSDLFGEWVPFEMVDKVFAVMALTPWHTYQVLTKRADRMLEYLTGHTGVKVTWSDGSEINRHGLVFIAMGEFTASSRPVVWPLPNVWLGVSAEDQKRWDERVEILGRIPAAIRFVSYEPAIGHIDPGNAFDDPPDGSQYSKIDWVIVGGESGPGARPFNLRWAQEVVQRCKAAGAYCFVKQVGAKPFHETFYDEPIDTYPRLKSRKGGDMEEWPEDLRVRQFPDGLTQKQEEVTA